MFLNNSKEKNAFKALDYEPEKAKQLLQEIKQLTKKNKTDLDLNQNFILTKDKTNPVLNQILQKVKSSLFNKQTAN